MPGRAGRFVLGASGVAAAAGVAALAGSGAARVSPSLWGVSGWAAAAIPGIFGGGWLAARLGSAGAAFLAGIGVTMAVRAVAIVTGLGMALREGGTAPWMFLGGFATCFVPLAVFEAVWFWQQTRRPGNAGPGV